MNTPSPKNTPLFTIFTCIALFLLSPALNALGATITWNGSAGANFNTAGNWSGGTLGIENISSFEGATPKTIDVGTAVSVAGLNFTAGGYTIESAASRALSIGAGGITAANSLGTINFTAPVTYTAVNSITNIGAGTTVTLTGTAVFTGGAGVVYEKSGEGTLSLVGASGTSVFRGFAAGTTILVSNGVLNLDKTVALSATGTVIGNGFFAVTGDGAINVKQHSQFGSGYHASLKLAGTGSVNFDNDLGINQSFGGAYVSGSYGISFGTGWDGAAADGGGAITIGAGTTVNVEDVRYQGTTAASITGAGILGFRTSAPRFFNIANGSGTYKELTIGTRMAPAAQPVTKLGAGTMVITGSSTGTGAWSVTEGKLLANNIANSAVGTGALTVFANATLGGTGRIALTNNNSVTLQQGAILSPGDINEVTGATEIESLDFVLAGTGKLDLSADAKYVFDLGAATTAGVTYDTVKVAGTVLFSPSTLDFADFTFNKRTGFGEGRYTLFSATTLTGLDIFSVTGSMGAGYEGTISAFGSNLVLDVIAVPEPATWAMLLGGMGMLGFAQRMRRRASL